MRQNTPPVDALQGPDPRYSTSVITMPVYACNCGEFRTLDPDAMKRHLRFDHPAAGSTLACRRDAPWSALVHCHRPKSHSGRHWGWFNGEGWSW